jgi:oxygen-dependent protoporphyrinogen oxidase
MNEIDLEACGLLRGIPHQSTAVVTLGFAGNVSHPLDGTGYVIPRVLGRDVLACTWSSSKFELRAPRGGALKRVFIGGAHRPGFPELDDNQLIRIAREELATHLGIVSLPVLVRVTRWIRAMPQYEIGHLERVGGIEQRLMAHPWLAVAGNAYRGVGVPDCIASGVRAADRVLSHLDIGLS